MKTEAIPYLITFSIFCMTWKVRPSFSIEKAIKNENKITGNPVPRAKIGGSNKLSVDFKTKGIKTPKNKTPL